MIDRQRLRTFLLGSVAGVLAGILLAPRSGKELRGSVANRAGEARERSRETYFEKQERMQERLAEMREGSHRQRTAPERDATIGVGDETPAGSPDKTYGVSGRPPLRDVSRDVYEEDPEKDITEAPDTRPEELREKVRETRERLRERLDRPIGERDD